MNQTTPENIEGRSPLAKARDAVITVGAYVSAYLFSAAGRDPEIREMIIPEWIDASPNMMNAAAYLALGGAVVSTCVFAARQK